MLGKYDTKEQIERDLYKTNNVKSFVVGLCVRKNRCANAKTGCKTCLCFSNFKEQK